MAHGSPCYIELKKKISSTNCLGVPRPKGEIILITDACDVGGGCTLYQWRGFNPAELLHRRYHASGLNRDGTLKHDYPANEWRLVPLGHWNWKWNQARSNYSTYDQELLVGMLVLSSQPHLLGTNPNVLLCEQEPVKTFQKGPPPEKGGGSCSPFWVSSIGRLGLWAWGARLRQEPIVGSGKSGWGIHRWLSYSPWWSCRR